MNDFIHLWKVEAQKNLVALKQTYSIKNGYNIKFYTELIDYLDKRVP